jgi:hypothetical protein
MGDFDLQQLELLLILLVGLIFVTLAGLAVYVIIANRRERSRLQQSLEEAKLAPRPVQQITGQILSLVRDKAGAPLQVEVAGTKYASFHDIEHPQVKRQVVAAAMELIQFTRVLSIGETQPASMDKTESWREDLRDESAAELASLRKPPSADEERESAPQLVIADPEQVEKRFLNLLADMGQTAPPDKPSLIKSVQQQLTPKRPDYEQPRSFVDDIEDIIQRRIRLIPALVGRDIHVKSGPGGSVHFVFEGQEYENLEQVPNMTARQLIQDSIQEWDETT